MTAPRPVRRGSPAPGASARFLKTKALQRSPLKQGADILSLLQILVRGDAANHTPVALKRRLECVRFYFAADGTHRLFAAAHRSGNKWIELGLALAFDLARGGDGAYEYEGDWFFPRDGLAAQRLDWRVPSGEWDRTHRRANGPALGQRRYFTTHIPYFKVRCARLKAMRIVVVTRSILASLESLFFKLAISSHDPGVSLDDQDSFDWDRYLTEFIDFFNSWGDVMTWHPAIAHFRYEDLKADPVGGHKAMLDFWGYEIPEECIAEGFRRASKKEMLKKMASGSEAALIRASTRSAGERGVIGEERMAAVIERLKRELVYDFGYDFENNRSYGIPYD